MQKIKWLAKTLINWSLLFVLVAGFIVGYNPFGSSVKAQSENGSWSSPINLSQSGSSSDPAIVVDHDGLIHVIWYDEFDGYKYTESSDGENWSTPSTVNFPFQDFRPRLVSDSGRYIYAFWQDDTGAMYSSRVPGDEFGNSAAWEGSLLLAQVALGYDVALGDDGALNLAYLRPLDTPDAPAGVYYRRVASNGNWSTSQPIQTSLYLRGMDVADAHVRIASGTISGTESVFITWDERPLKKVFLIKSGDGGDNWDEPLEVDQPNVESGFSTPFNLDVKVWDGTVLLLWETGVPQSNCTNHYLVSADGGNTWNTRGQVYNDLLGCSDQNNFWMNRSDMLILQANISGQITFLAWNGEQWSAPQVQTDLAAFENPRTYGLINLGCQKVTNNPNSNRLLAVSCEQSQDGDIWFLSRDVGDLSDWFPPESAWSKPEELFDISPEIESLHLIADSAGNFHAFWAQPVTTGTTGTGGAIFYARWDGNAWSNPAPILVSPEGRANNPSIALGQDGRLFVVWSSGVIGDLYFSWADADRAINPSEWSEPVSLPSPNSAASSPDLIIESSGNIVVIYAVPLNEDRGIYYVESSDKGLTWSTPIQVFDAVVAGWEMVQSPHMVIDPGGTLNVLWQRYPFPGDPDPQALYFSHFSGISANDETIGLAKGWSVPQQIDEGLIPWSKFVSTPGGGLYNLWLKTDPVASEVVQQYSADGGNTWSSASTLGNLSEFVESVDVIQDRSNQIHLLQLVTDSNQQIALRHWQTEAGDWSLKDGQSLAISQSDRHPLLVAAAIDLNGLMQVVYGLVETSPTNGTRAFLSATHRIISQDTPGQITPSPATQPPMISATPISTDTVGNTTTPISTPEITSTVNLADLPGPTSGALSGNLMGMVLISAVVSGALILFVVLFRAEPIKELLRQVFKDAKNK